MKSLPEVKTTQLNFVESSYNEGSSKKLEMVLTDSLGRYFSPDVRIYDSMQNVPLKYVSVILRLKKNYIQEDESYAQLNALTSRLIYSELPRESFSGRLQYIYKGTGQLQGRTARIGINPEVAREK